MNYMLILNYFFDKVTSSKLLKKKQTKKTPKTQQKQHPIHVNSSEFNDGSTKTRSLV